MKISVYIFSLLAFIFWAFIYKSHIFFVEQFSYFLYCSEYWREYALQPGGWAAYSGNFLSQFYYNRWAGALIQTGLFCSLMFFSKRILNKTSEIGSMLMFAAPLSALLLWALQCDNRFTPGDALTFIFPYAITYLYISISQVAFRRVALTAAIVPAYLFAGAVPLCSLIVACTVYELFLQKDKWRYCLLLWTPLAILLPQIWQLVYLTRDDNLFKILSFEVADQLSYAPLLILAYIPVCLIIISIVAQTKIKVITPLKFKILRVIVVLVCQLVFGYYLFTISYDRLEEQKFAMSIATSEGNWDNVLKISRKVKNPDMQTTYFTNLALAVKGELPEKMFSYPQIGEYGLLLMRLDEYSMRYGSEFFYHIGILNEAIRWIYDAHILRRKGMDYHTLKRLALWNKEAGYLPVAEKYFDILEKTLMYRSWAKTKRSETMHEKQQTTANKSEFFIGGREPISDIARHYDNDPQNVLTRDYMLCYLLLKNDFQRFMNVFMYIYEHNMYNERLPQAYQEAILLVANMGRIELQNFPIEQINITRFEQFKQLAEIGNRTQLKRRFSDTLWYYIYNI